MLKQGRHGSFLTVSSMNYSLADQVRHNIARFRCEDESADKRHGSREVSSQWQFAAGLSHQTGVWASPWCDAHAQVMG